MTLSPFWRWCKLTFGSGKKRKVCGKCKAHKKAGPQFAFANEELAYRSAVQNSPAICVFLVALFAKKFDTHQTDFFFGVVATEFLHSII